MRITVPRMLLISECFAGKLVLSHDSLLKQPSQLGLVTQKKANVWLHFPFLFGAVLLNAKYPA